MAKSELETHAGGAAHFSFGALLLALFGWANLEVLLFSTNAGLPGHLTAAVSGLCLSTVAYRRCRFWRARPAVSILVSRTPIHSTAGDIAIGALLALAGFILAYLMRTGFVAATAIGAVAFTFVPWFRIDFCRHYFFTSLGLLVAGGLPILIVAVKFQHPIVVLIHTWVLWTLAAGLALRALWLQRSEVHPSNQAQIKREAYDKDTDLSTR